MAKKKTASGAARPSSRNKASRTKTSRSKYVYFFGGGKADGDRTMKDLLGGKGSGLAEMTNAGLPVPPGFTISTEACNLYYQQKRKTPEVVDLQMVASLRKLEQATGASLGDAKNPLLVSVRSGAKFSMPGMMDTILNLGMNDRTVEAIKARTGNGRFAWDSYRRFIQMYGNVVLEIHKDAFEHELDAVKKENRAKIDADLTEANLVEVVERYKQVVRDKTGKDFPQEPRAQLRGARDAVFRSWNNAARHRLPQHLRHPPRPRHRGERPGDGLREHGRPLGHRRRLHPQPLDRRQGVLRRVPAERAGRGRRGGHPHAAADQRARAGAAQGLQASCARSPSGWRSTTRTCRTSSSPSRTTRSTCSRPATASAPVSPRCTSRWTWWTRS